MHAHTLSHAHAHMHACTHARTHAHRHTHTHLRAKGLKKSFQKRERFFSEDLKKLTEVA